MIKEKEGRFYYNKCSYETLKDALLIGVFGCCGCSQIDEVFKIMKAVLISFDEEKTYKEITSEIFNDNLGAYYIVTGVLDGQGLIEHGVAIRYCWLTGKGKEILHLLKSLEEENEPSGNH